MSRTLWSMVLASGLAAAAQAQVNWTTQVQFCNRVGGVDSAPLAGNTLSLTATGTYTFTVQAGIFSITGLDPNQANWGVQQWTSGLTSSGLAAGESLGVVPNQARVSPFTFGPATSFGGTVGGGGTTITNVNCARDLSGGASAPWLWNTQTNQPNPQPTVPSNPSPGSGSFVSVWRFNVTITSLVGPNVVINLSGQAGPVVQWATFGTNPPQDADTPGQVNFLGLTPSPVLRNYPTTSLTLVRGCGASATISSQPVAQSVTVGAPVFFATTATVTSGNPVYQWRRNGVNLAGSGRIAGVTGPVLMISPTVAADAGTYSVVVTDGCASATSAGAALGVFCPADADRNGVIQPADIGVFVANWFSALSSGGC